MEDRVRIRNKTEAFLFSKTRKLYLLNQYYFLHRHFLLSNKTIKKYLLSTAFINFFSKLYLLFHDQILPSSGLINAFSNEVGRKSVLKVLPVFKGVMDLGIRHASTLKPAVEDLADPPQHALSAP